MAAARKGFAVTIPQSIFSISQSVSAIWQSVLLYSKAFSGGTSSGSVSLLLYRRIFLLYPKVCWLSRKVFVQKSHSVLLSRKVFSGGRGRKVFYYYCIVECFAFSQSNAGLTSAQVRGGGGGPGGLDVGMFGGRWWGELCPAKVH